MMQLSSTASFACAWRERGWKELAPVSLCFNFPPLFTPALWVFLVCRWLLMISTFIWIFFFHSKWILFARYPILRTVIKNDLIIETQADLKKKKRQAIILFRSVWTQTHKPVFRLFHPLVLFLEKIWGLTLYFLTVCNCLYRFNFLHKIF